MRPSSSRSLVAVFVSLHIPRSCVARSPCADTAIKSTSSLDVSSCMATFCNTLPVPSSVSSALGMPSWNSSPPLSRHRTCARPTRAGVPSRSSRVLKACSWKRELRCDRAGATCSAQPLRSMNGRLFLPNYIPRNASITNSGFL